MAIRTFGTTEGCRGPARHIWDVGHEVVERTRAAEVGADEVLDDCGGGSGGGYGGEG